MMMKEVLEPAEKRDIARRILEALPDWFEITETREAYIRESAEQICFAAYDGDQPVGFLCLKQTGKETAELAVRVTAVIRMAMETVPATRPAQVPAVTPGLALRAALQALVTLRDRLQEMHPVQVILRVSLRQKSPKAALQMQVPIPVK